ncbi:hypothetical protein MMC12_000794 [Toensbergia leucococca]|nr:hypothetical protein [Toensbergia leucococca]
MAVKGQRFHIDLDHDVDDEKYHRSLATPTSVSASVSALNIIRDVEEHSPSLHLKSSPPTSTNGSSVNGFPIHKKRSRPSTFKQRRRDAPMRPTQELEYARPVDSPQLPSSGRHEQDASVGSAAGSHDQRELTGSRSIDEENRKRLATMSAEEIEQEREDLMAALSPSLIERLLKKANIDEGRTDIDEALRPTEARQSPKKPFAKRVTFEAPEDPPPPHTKPEEGQNPLATPDDESLIPPIDFPSISSPMTSSAPPRIHFPSPLPVPALDPSDPDFLESLHSEYFPDLPSDPSAMAWMAPLPTKDSPADKDSPYNPSQASFPPSSIRFDFRGRLLPPRLARQISTTKGLHHHGSAPEAAGYTIPELAHLMRSAFPSQRCIAYQTLGRLLYRLGRGDFGDEGEELCTGLWICVEKGRVIDGLVAEAGREEGTGNRTCRITATEAVWLWRKGGGRKWKAQ